MLLKEQIPTDEHPPGTVIEVFQKGWMLKDRLVRPAMVVVAAEPPKPEPDEASTSEEEATETDGDANSE